ncbi:MAG: membrane protein insertase YidC [Myxococcota bacterium]|nr:membrane protein insertase YidC [Myxococcota bacterium]
MDEQRRVYLAIVLSVVVLMGWQMIMGPQVAPVVPPTEAPTEGISERPAMPSSDAAAVPGADSAQPAELSAATETSDVVAQPVVETPAQDFNWADALTRQTWSNEGPSIKALNLTQYTERDENDVMNPVALTDKLGRQARINVFSDQVLLEKRWEVEETATGPVLSATEPNGLTWRMELRRSNAAYATDVILSVNNKATRPIVSEASLNLYIDYPEEGSILSPPLMYRGLCYSSDDELVDAEKGDVEDGPLAMLPGNARWAAVDYQYFVVAAVAQENVVGGCKAQASQDAIELTYQLLFETLPPGQTKTLRYTLYAGPKSSDELKAVSENLTFAIDYSIMGIPLGALARPMILALNIFHDVSQSWGVAIILLTLVVKLILFPVTYKSVVSMRKMQLLKPELDKIKERFANDKEKQQMAQLKLMQEMGVNPLSGCLPMLLQMPVWFALYRALWSAVDLYQQSFLWIPDLTQPESFPILALLVGAVTAIQQKVTPTTGDPAQARMMMIVMPIMLTIFMVALPSGLVFYILVNSLLTIVQQIVINHRVPKPQPA